MKVSFLITYYNQKEYVHESIQSVLKIRKSNIEWEILVGDDGSTDGTIEEIEKYVKTDPEHIKLFIMPRERGKKYFSVPDRSLIKPYPFETLKYSTRPLRTSGDSCLGVEITISSWFISSFL